MIELYMLACQIELEDVQLRNAELRHVAEVSQDGKTREEMWVENCVARAQIWQ